jgi:hypothetical protein
MGWSRCRCAAWLVQIDPGPLYHRAGRPATAAAATAFAATLPPPPHARPQEYSQSSEVTREQLTALLDESEQLLSDNNYKVGALCCG